MILQNTPKSGSSDDFMRIQDILTLCLARWRWFVLSVLVCLAIAVYYVLSTPPVYTRTASILIKEDSKGQSLSGDVGSSFAQLGLVQSNTNVNNEMVSIQSPSVMYDVVRRLHLDVEYHTDGTLYRRVLYGADCPVQLSFLELGEQETASLTLRLTRDSGIRLTDFERNGQSVYLMICSLTDSKGRPMEKGERLEVYSQKLQQAIKGSLRRGDSFTKYNPAQFLILLVGTSRENCDLVFRRIADRFAADHKAWRSRLDYYVSSVADVESDRSRIRFQGNEFQWD